MKFAYVHPTTPFKLFKVALKFILPFTVLLLLIFALHFSLHNSLDLMHRQTTEKMQIQLASKILQNNLHTIITDTRFLTHYTAQFITNKGNINDTLLKLFRNQFLSFSQNKQIYDQIRLFDVDGNELIRVNYENGQSLLVDESELQNKRNRFYFKKIAAQIEDIPYVSPLEPNIENGHIQLPIKPVIRVGQTIRSKDGKLLAVVVLNYLGKSLFDDLNITAGDNDRTITLIDSESFYITGTEHLQFGYLFNEKESFEKSHQEAWQAIKSSKFGQLMNHEGLFTFSSIDSFTPDRPYPELDNNNRRWKVISYVNQEILNAPCLAFLGFYVILYFAVFIVAVIISMVIALNVLRRKNVENQNEYESQFRAILENIQLLAVMVDSTGNIVFCNDYFLNLTQWTREKVLGKNWHGCFVPEDESKIAENLLQEISTKNKAITDIEYSIVTRTNQRKIIAWNATTTKNSMGQTDGITYIGMDITAQRQIEEKIRLLNRAVEQSPVIIMITDTHGRIEYVNSRFFELTGYSREEIIGFNPKKLKSGETPDVEYKKLWNSITQGGEWLGTFHNRKKNGDLYWEKAFISAVKNDEGVITNFLAIKEDITEIRALKDEVTHHQGELTKERELAAVGRMANMIAHDLRNPLSSVKMGVQILHKKASKQNDEKQEELMDISLQQIRYMEEILKDLLSYSKQDELKLEWLTMDKLLDDVVFLLHKQIDDSHSVVKRQYQTGIPTLHGDEVKLKQIFSNLICNAIQACETNSHSTPEIIISIRLCLAETVTGIQVEIIDNGPGIDPDIQDSLFEPFVTTRAKGTGLGLAIVKRVIKQHQGQISLEPVTTGGTRVKVTLPVGPVEPVTTNERMMEINNYE